MSQRKDETPGNHEPRPHARREGTHDGGRRSFARRIDCAPVDESARAAGRAARGAGMRRAEGKRATHEAQR
jgi:hypothetical protein